MRTLYTTVASGRGAWLGLGVMLALLAAWAWPATGEEPGAPGQTAGQPPEKSIRQWTQAGPLGAAPKRTSELLPLSDQANQAKWVRNDEVWDEFGARELDKAKWSVGLYWWQGRQPAWFNPANVTVADGQLQLTMRKETVPPEMARRGYHDYSAAALHSKVRCGYGYYEIKARPMNSAGSSSFWFQVEDRKAHPGWGTEIDVFEIGGRAKGFQRKLNMNVHVFSTPTEKRHWSVGGVWLAPQPLADDFHVYGLDWTPQEIVYYFDGRPVRRVQNTHWHQPLHLIFDSETMPEWFGMPADGDLPSTFRIEYVRAWKRPTPQ